MNQSVGERPRPPRINSEMLAAAIFVGFGLIAAGLGWDYGFGSMRQMGTGAMPVIVGAALVLMGIMQGFNALRSAKAGTVHPRAFNSAELRPLLLILAAVFAFAALILPTGLIPALSALVLIAWFAQKGGTRIEIVAALVAVVLLMIAIFKFGLGLPLRLFAFGF